LAKSGFVLVARDGLDASSLRGDQPAIGRDVHATSQTMDTQDEVLTLGATDAAKSRSKKTE
jgi:hypothetical protein